ncbi:MAG: SDR family oxidoreductase [Firmicutes bacterium]|nr:SDR family oxidoreductase [Bacillota bacterium]
MKNLRGKYAVITGAAKGIGLGIAERFAQEGVNLLMADILGDEAKREASRLSAEYGIKAEGYQVDLTSNDEIESMMSFAFDTFGRIDILVCNAGITIHNWATDYSIEEIDKVFDLDLRGYYLCARTAARYMKKKGKGNIVMISSANSVIYHSKRSLYNVSKAATAGMAGTLGVELARFGIRVNSVGPGYVATDLVRQGVENGTIKMDRNFQVIPEKRFIEVEEIASVVAFLASDESSAINGQNIIADLGWSKNALPEDTDME